ncbi:MAG: Gfo/Idh/MocA family oxidoreductase [Bdellovibrionales bacterium]|nr:Gfo/Idh/MocA family oxidoreductase [Bdellovibrionales bacterium]
MNHLTPPLRWAILGVGKHVQKKLIPSFTRTDHAALTALGSNHFERAEQLDEPGSTLQVSDYASILASAEVDAVFIALPNHLHAQWAIAALEANKHVLCEKPIALDAVQAERMREAARHHDRRLAEAFMYRFHPQQVALRRLLQGGMIGELRLIEAQLQYFLEDQANIRARPETGGGGLLDVGCYLIDFARTIFGVPAKCHAIRRMTASGVDETAFVQLQFDGGRAAHLSCGIALTRANSLTVYGTHGAVHVPSAFLVPRNKKGRIEITRANGAKELLVTEPLDTYAAEIDAFSQWVRSGRTEHDVFEDGVENMKIIDAVRRVW